MKIFSYLSLTGKMLVALLTIGMIPLLILFFVIRTSTIKNTEENMGGFYEIVAENVMEKVEGIMAEGYSDVQAFVTNGDIHDQSGWYSKDPSVNKVSNTINNYVKLYQSYSLMIAVDLEGKVIGVNTVNGKGDSINTDFIYQENYKQADWFVNAISRNFLGESSKGGSYVQDLYIDPDVKRITGGHGLTVSFSTPIHNREGQVIGVWNSRMNFETIESVFQETYHDLAADGHVTTELTLLDSKGNIIVDHDPGSNNFSEDIKRDLSVIGKFNLAEKGVEIAQKAVSGETGNMVSWHARKQLYQIGGYAHSHGLEDYPGLGWSTMARLDRDQVLKAANTTLNFIKVTIGIAALGLTVSAWFLGWVISNPILKRVHVVDGVGSDIAATFAQVSAASQELADGASRQAASLEQTGSALEEMTSMTKQNADNAQAAKNTASEARMIAESGLQRSHEMERTMGDVKHAVSQMKSAVEDMQASGTEVSKIVSTIDEIAFQTNILALNAAVEAARAGEAGMGFAVVADEVRNLAQRSAEAAKETSQKIESSLKSSSHGIQSSSKVAESLQEIEERSAQVAECFNQLLEQVRHVDETVSNIASSSKEQHQGIDQINIGVSEINRVTQSNAANAEETASSCSQLESLSQSLKQTVEQLTMLLNGQRGQSTPTHIPVRKKNPTVPHSINNTPKQPAPQKNGYSAASLKLASHKTQEKDHPIAAARTSSKLIKSESHRTQDHHDEFMDF